MFAIAMMDRLAQLSTSALRSVACAVTRAFNTLRRVVINRSQARALAGLDDRALHDIGLSRSQVQGALGSGVFADPSLAVRRYDMERRSLASVHQDSMARFYTRVALPAGKNAAKPSEISFQIGLRSGRESIA